MNNQPFQGISGASQAQAAPVRVKYCLTILVDVQQRYDNFFAFNSQYREQCPNITNIIESYNSHLQGRLKSIKGFQSFHSAERWLNAWMIRRRTKPFTDCEEPFKHLNGKCSLEVALKKDAEFPEILGIRAYKKNKKEGGRSF